ncbi:MAG: YdiU family protein [Halieaceae bacterium]
MEFGEAATSIPGFDHSYARLGERFSTPQSLDPVSEPRLIFWNQELADYLGWPADPISDPGQLAALAGNERLTDSQPIATVYAGHQFGQFNPQLGDGRATLLGEWITPTGQRVDIQLKGAGPTPYSRGGDGRAPMGPVVREYVVSEAMAALGVPTSRALAAVATGERVFRNRAEPGAILTRVASSHLRVGTIQFFAMTRGGEGLKDLVDYVVARHFAASDGDADAKPAVTLLEGVCQHFARLVAHWQALGFVHGVLNTDNALLCGETIDFGPCAFMDHFDPQASFSSIDRQGRYAWHNQPGIMHWNLAVLAECLLPLIDDSAEAAQQIAQSIVDRYPLLFHSHHQNWLASKLGLDHIHDSDAALVQTFHDTLTSEKLDFTLAFRWLTEQANGNLEHSPLPELFTAPASLQAWTAQWSDRIKHNTGDQELVTANMYRVNPAIIPRNHLVQRAIDTVESGNLEWGQAWIDRLATPYEWRAGDEDWARSPLEEERVTQTFCGT